MAIQSSFGFKVSSFDPIDTRILLSKAEMLAADPDDYPDVYFAFCIDDGQWYRFDYELDTLDPETGHFTKLELGGSTPSAETGPIADRPAADDRNPGDMWYDPDTGKTYIVVKDSEGNKVWVEKTPAPGEMLYDATNDKILYFDGTEWKEIGSGVAHVPSVDPTQPGTEGEIVYDEATGQYKIYEDGVWLTLAKTWEGTTAQYNTLGGNTWSTNHPDVIIFITD